MRLALDVMGGDHAPDEILKGAINALGHLSAEDRLILVGPPAVIEDVLRERGIRDPRIEVAPADEVIGMDEPPVEAVKTKKGSSIVRMMAMGSHKAERAGEPRADVVISAGNTGACVSAATMHMRRLPGVHRPGICVTIPTLRGPLVLSDVGANPEPRASHLAQYAVMAETYARHVLGVQSPRVAQINIGHEDSKGTDLIREARDILRRTPGINYVGYVESRDLLEGCADVVVCDGFVGNIMLKMAEGLARSLFKVMFHEIFEADPELAMRLEPVAKVIFKKNDYHEFGGAPLLGVNGYCLICHGSSQARTISAAIRNAKDLVRSRLNEAIVARLAETSAATGPEEAAGAGPAAGVAAQRQPA